MISIQVVQDTTGELHHSDF